MVLFLEMEVYENQDADLTFFLFFFSVPFMVTDDSMTILMAFQTPEIEILGLTTIFGNVSTEDATRNALLLVCVMLDSSLFVMCFFF